MSNQRFGFLFGSGFGFAEKRISTSGNAKAKTIKPNILYIHVVENITVYAHKRTNAYTRAYARIEKLWKNLGFWFGSFRGCPA